MKLITKITLISLTLFMAIQLKAQPAQGVKMPERGSYFIQSAISYGRNNNGCWERPGGGNTAHKGDNIRIWQRDNAETKLFSFEPSRSAGWYKIVVKGTNRVVADVSGAKLTKNGANIQFWDDNGSSAQRFLFRHLGNGRFKIYSAEGKIVNLANQSDNNGNNVQIWDDHNDMHCEWYVVDKYTKKAFVPTQTIPSKVKVVGSKIDTNKKYRIQSAMSHGRGNRGYLEFPGSNWKVKGNKMDIWTIDGGQNKVFKFTKSSNGLYYLITASGVNGTIDCVGGNTSKGTRLQLWETNKSNAAQQFYLKHLGNGRFKIYHRSGKVVCLADNKNDNNGNRVHLWDDHNAVTTEWFLLDINGRPYIPR